MPQTSQQPPGQSRRWLAIWLSSVLALTASVVMFVCAQPHRCCCVISTGAGQRAVSWAAVSPLLACVVPCERIDNMPVTTHLLLEPSARSVGSVAAAASRQIFLAHIGGLYGP